MRATPLERRIADIVAPVVEDKGYSLVDVRLTSEHGTQILQVLAENPQTRNLLVDDCAVLSREISALLDVEDPIRGAYRLEISSPGIDRPLTRAKDFEDYTGFEAHVEMGRPAENGQKRFRGILRGLKDGEIRMDTEHGPVSLPFEDLQKAKLVMNDQLLKTKKH